MEVIKYIIKRGIHNKKVTNKNSMLAACDIDWLTICHIKTHEGDFWSRIEIKNNEKVKDFFF